MCRTLIFLTKMFFFYKKKEFKTLIFKSQNNNRSIIREKKYNNLYHTKQAYDYQKLYRKKQEQHVLITLCKHTVNFTYGLLTATSTKKKHC